MAKLGMTSDDMSMTMMQIVEAVQAIAEDMLPTIHVVA